MSMLRVTNLLATLPVWMKRAAAAAAVESFGAERWDESELYGATYTWNCCRLRWSPLSCPWGRRDDVFEQMVNVLCNCDDTPHKDCFRSSYSIYHALSAVSNMQ